MGIFYIAPIAVLRYNCYRVLIFIAYEAEYGSKEMHKWIYIAHLKPTLDMMSSE
jgi:hypothetical protein